MKKTVTAYYIETKWGRDWERNEWPHDSVAEAKLNLWSDYSERIVKVTTTTKEEIVFTKEAE